MHGSPIFLQEQRPKHPLSGLQPHFVSSLHTSETHLAASFSMVGHHLPVFSIPTELDLVDFALVQVIVPKQIKFDRQLLKHVA